LSEKNFLKILLSQILLRKMAITESRLAQLIQLLDGKPNRIAMRKPISGGYDFSEACSESLFVKNFCRTISRQRRRSSLWRLAAYSAPSL
jgi:hypothetical protein